MENLTVVAALNAVLGNGLAAINQYFLHARILKHQKVLPLADTKYKLSIDKMKYADQLVERILQLGGVPAVYAAEALAIGSNVEQILQADLALEATTQQALQSAMVVAETARDTYTFTLLSTIYSNGEQHIECIQKQQALLHQLGLQTA